MKTQYGYDAKAIAKQFGRRRIEESLQTYEDRYRLNEMDDASYRERLDKIQEQMNNPVLRDQLGAKINETRLKGDVTMEELFLICLRSNEKTEEGSDHLSIDAFNTKFEQCDFDPNWRSSSLMTLLHAAVQHDNRKLVLRLLDEGCNPKLKDKYGNTPRDYAEKKGFSYIARMINTGILTLRYQDQDELDEEHRRRTLNTGSRRTRTLPREHKEEEEMDEDTFMATLFDICLKSEQDSFKMLIERDICSELFNPSWRNESVEGTGKSWDVLKALVYGGNVETAKMLLKAGCNPSSRDVGFPLFSFFS